MTRIAKKSFGEPYECVFDWPDDCFVQCGENGLVISASKEDYNTAFFEAFPKNPSTFIRGEGKNIMDAEQQAWNKHNKYLACEKHEYRRHREDSEHGICIHCGLFTTHVFAPVYSCDICQKKEVSLEYDNKYYCLEHFISIMPTFSVLDLNKDDFNGKNYLIYNQSEALKLGVLCQNNLIDKSQEEYKEINKWNKITDSFSTYFHNKIIEEANSINIGLTMFEHFKIKTNISTDRELYQQIFINYLCENIKDLNLISKNVSIDIQKHINTKKKNPD